MGFPKSGSQVFRIWDVTMTQERHSLHHHRARAARRADGVGEAVEVASVVSVSSEWALDGRGEGTILAFKVTER